MFRAKYRVNRDWYFTFLWAVEVKKWYWPFWREYRDGLNTKMEAQELVDMLS